MELKILKCNNFRKNRREKCGHKWIQRTLKPPTECPKCRASLELEK